MILGFLLPGSSPTPNISAQPNESNRKLHPNGFSIIAPSNMRVTINEDILRLSPATGDSRLTPTSTSNFSPHHHSN